MFYISGQQGDKYGITDTSDNVTEYHTVDYIKRCVNMGIKIYGAVFRGDNYLITVYNYDRDADASDNNAVVVSGLKLYVRNDGHLYDIQLADKNNMTPRVNLCDYCNYIENGFLRHMREYVDKEEYYGKPELVIDDRIVNMESKCLDDLVFTTVTLNICNLNKPNFVNAIYNVIYQAMKTYGESVIDEYISDSSMRHKCHEDEYDILKSSKNIDINSYPQSSIDFVIRNNRARLTRNLGTPKLTVVTYLTKADAADNKWNAAGYCMMAYGAKSVNEILRYLIYIGEKDSVFWASFKDFLDKATMHALNHLGMQCRWSADFI